MAATVADARVARLQEQLKYDTPFWAGGFTKDADGAWRKPGPNAFRGCAKIVNKQAKLATIVPNDWQLEFDDKLEAQRAAGLPVRALVLKARKLGFSTWIALKFLQRVTQIEYLRAVVVAQDVKTAGIILDMARLCHAHLPTVEELGLGFSIRPDIVAESNSLGRKYMQFGEGSPRLRRNGRTGDSIFEIDTAGSPESGRGSTPHDLHLSEVAWWEGAQTTRKMLSLLNAVPYELETMVIQETTANGMNHFWRRWVAARDGAEDPDTGETYICIFVPWQRDPAAARLFATPEDRARFEETIGDTSRYGELVEDELMLVEAYGLTPEQLNWRRAMIRTQHEGSVELFNQENPHSDEAAFIGSGRTVFGGILVSRAIKGAEAAPEPVAGALRPGAMIERRSRAGTVMVPREALWVPGDEMRPGERALQVWEHPKKATDEWPDEVKEADRIDGAYVVGVDVAGGEANTFTQGDYHCVQVFDHRSHAQVAVHASRMPIEELPLFVLLVALYYNMAWLAVEVNNHGIAVVDPLAKTYRYKRMYRRKRFDVVRQEQQNKVGWATDQVSKPLMEGTFAAALATDTAGIRDIRTARELSTYVITEKGKHEANDGEHDDRLVAAMIAHQVMELLRPKRAGKKEPRRPEPPLDPITGYR